MTFKNAVEKTTDIRHALRAGLKALKKADKAHVTADDTSRLSGSIDLDAALAMKLPQERRWDYAVGHRPSNSRCEMIYWIEIHPASGNSSVGAVLGKLESLRSWLRDRAPLLDVLRPRRFIWISSGRTSFTLSSPQQKRFAVFGLRHVGHILRIADEITA